MRRTFSAWISRGPPRGVRGRLGHGLQDLEHGGGRGGGGGKTHAGEQGNQAQETERVAEEQRNVVLLVDGFEGRPLRKDFVLASRAVKDWPGAKDPTDLRVLAIEAAAHGADAILLIVAILTDEQLAKFHSLAIEAGLAVLVEVHDEEELNRALKISPALLGVNNRNLKTFKVDLATTEVLAAKMEDRRLRMANASAPASSLQPLVSAERLRRAWSCQSLARQ